PMGKPGEGDEELPVERAPEAECIARVDGVVEGGVDLRELGIALLLQPGLADGHGLAAGVGLVRIGDQSVEQVTVDRVDMEVDEVDADLTQQLQIRLPILL